MKRLIIFLTMILSLLVQADTKISQLPTLAPSFVGSGDMLPFTNVASGSTKSLLLSNLLSIPSLQSPTFTGTVTANSFVGPLTGNVTGNASTASTATTASSATIGSDTTTNATMYPVWVSTNSGSQALKTTNTKLSFNPFSGLLTASGFSGPLTGNVTGNVTGSSGTFTGNLTGEVTSTGMTTTVSSSAVIGKVITGFSSGAGSVSGSDTIVQAFNKIDGNYQTNSVKGAPNLTTVGAVPYVLSSGVLTNEAQLAKSRGGTGADNTSVTFPTTGTIVTEAGTETLTNKTMKYSLSQKSTQQLIQNLVP